MRQMLLLVAPLSLAGCVKTAVIDGVVVDARGPVTGLQQPLRGAEVAVSCPEGKGLPPPATSDAGGHVKLTLGRRFARACVVDVTMTGFEPARITLGDVCSPHEDSPNALYCGLETVVVVRLSPSPSPI